MTTTDATQANYRGEIDTGYGTILIGPQVGRWRRDRYMTRMGHEEAAHVFSCGPADMTAHHVVYPSGYDARCSCCWLNIGHTEAVHADAITRI